MHKEVLLFTALMGLQVRLSGPFKNPVFVNYTILMIEGIRTGKIQTKQDYDRVLLAFIKIGLFI